MFISACVEKSSVKSLRQNLASATNTNEFKNSSLTAKPLYDVNKYSTCKKVCNISEVELPKNQLIRKLQEVHLADYRKRN